MESNITDSATERLITKVNEQGATTVLDTLVVEEPLSIGISLMNTNPPIYDKTISITMRTPGADQELAVGFLYTEGIIRDQSQIKTIETAANAVEVFLHNTNGIDLSKLERHFYTTSSCGVCGKASLESVRTEVQVKPGADIFLSSNDLRSLPSKHRAAQTLFESTGGIHGAALFSQKGELRSHYEDVGRHNALDKLIGHALMDGSIPLESEVLVLSGRASFELIQKSAMAGLQIVAAVGAPSSLAVDMAAEFDITLVGFLSDNRFNIYNAPRRIIV